MRRIRNVDKTWDAVRAISPSDYHLYFFIKLDTKSEDFFPNSTKSHRLDDLSLKEIEHLIFGKNVMLIYVEGGDEE